MAYKLTKAQLGLTHEELAKDIEMKRALAILQQLDPKVDIKWVKKGAKAPVVPANRKLLVMVG